MARSEGEDDEFDVDSIGVDRMSQYFADAGALPSTAPSGSGVLSQQPPDPAAQVSILSLEALLQWLTDLLNLLSSHLVIKLFLHPS
jgi:hypothetical protein